MILEFISVIIFAIFLDLTFGDPKTRYHPTAWIGTLIAKMTPFAKNQNIILERTGGILIVTITSGVVILLLLSLEMGILLITSDYLTLLVSIIIGGLLLKTTIAIHGMEKHANAVLESLDQNNLDMARANLSMIVKRNTKNLDENHIISGVLESISENTVDGITGPLFYYGIFGLPGAFVYRVVNTADSMIGYKNNIFKNIGLFAAVCDTILNYIPSRLTGLVMIISAAILKNNWKGSYRTMMRDGKKTESPNAGYPMAALAGALDTKFEKVHHYQLGNGSILLTKEHIYSAILMMKLTTLIFFGIIIVPIVYVLSMVGWWIHA
ncbi:MAG: cobalamin biosynthesis protein [Nitrosopumilus sp.]